MKEIDGSLVTVRRSDVPSYLHSGGFYKSLDNPNGQDDHEECIDIPSHCYRSALTLDSVESVAHMLSTLRFWMVDTVCAEVVTFYVENRTPALDAVLVEYESQLDWLRTLRKYYRRSPSQRMDVAMRLGILSLVERWHEEGYPWTANSTRLAVSGGHLHCLVYAHKHRCPWHPGTSIEAAASGQLECLKYVCEHGARSDAITCAAAAARGQLDCLKYLHEQKCPLDSDIARAAAGAGQLACLQFLHENGGKWGASTTEAAAEKGHLVCLAYARENGCEWVQGDLCTTAARPGHLQCLKYAHERGCPLTSVQMVAARYGHVACLMYALQHEERPEPYAAEEAARFGQLEALRTLHARGCPLSAEVAAAAARYNYVDCLSYAHRHGCPITSATWEAAQAGSSPDCLSYLVRHQLGILPPLPSRPVLQRRAVQPAEEVKSTYRWFP
jgi:hypothetical protein